MRLSNAIPPSHRMCLQHEMPHYVCEGIVFDPVQKVGSFSDTSVASPAETMSILISGNPRSERLDAWIESRETKLVKHSHYTH